MEARPSTGSCSGRAAARPPKFTGDPTEEMQKAGWIKHGSSRGQWIYGPEATHVFRTFEKIVLEEIVGPLCYREMIFPKLDTWDVWKKSGHAQGVYPEIYFVCPPKTRDPAFWEEVMDHYKVTHEVPLELVKEKIDLPIGGMCYAQCPTFWGFLQGMTLPSEEMPITVFDRSGTSHRYESGGIHGIERVDEFHRIEIVWLGTKAQVLAEAEKLKACYKHIFEDILELHWRTAWVTPWFMAQEGKTGLSEMSGAGTVDYEAVLPYNGNWIEFQNLSVNGEKYPKGFTVKSQSGEALWSGCSGVGLERWASAFLSQKGLDPLIGRKNSKNALERCQKGSGSCEPDPQLNFDLTKCPLCCWQGSHRPSCAAMQALQSWQALLWRMRHLPYRYHQAPCRHHLYSSRYRYYQDSGPMPGLRYPMRHRICPDG